MPVSFARIVVGESYSRQRLADSWGYNGYEALARGVVTPRDDNKIILFVTREKPSNFEQYEDQLIGNTLHWEGPTDHFAEDRMLAAAHSGEEIHLFYRERHGSDFTYKGQLKLVSCERLTDRPSKFVLSM